MLEHLKNTKKKDQNYIWVTHSSMCYHSYTWVILVIFFSTHSENIPNNKWFRLNGKVASNHWIWTHPDLFLVSIVSPNGCRLDHEIFRPPFSPAKKTPTVTLD
jgi:hypothetical protein